MYCCSVTALLPFCRELCCKFATPWALLLVGVLHVCAVRPLVRPRGRVVGHVKKCTCLPHRNLKCCMFLRLNFFADLRAWDIRNVERFIRDLFDMERLKKENMRSNCRYTRTKNKLMMVMGGGLASRMLFMESLNIFSGAYEDELRAYENLGKCCEDMKDSGNVRAPLNELEAIEEDLTELEGLVRGYLSNASNSSAKERTELLKEELSKREVELCRIEQGIERAHAECKRQFGRSLRSETSDKPIPRRAGNCPQWRRRTVTKEEIGRVKRVPVVQGTDEATKFWCLKRAWCVFVYRCANYFHCRWGDARTASALDGWSCFFVYSVLSFVSAAKFSFTCCLGWKLRESVGLFTAYCSDCVLTEYYALCSISNTPITSQWRPSSLYSQQFSSSISDQISTDSSFLKRVIIPKFLGQKKKDYESGKRRFILVRLSPMHHLSTSC